MKTRRCGLLTGFKLPSEPSSARDGARRVLEAASGLGLPPDQLDAIETAVAEAVANAIEHGHRYERARLVEVEVAVVDDRLGVAVTDQGGVTGYRDDGDPADTAPTPEDGVPTRGRGLALMRQLADEVNVESGSRRHTVSLEFALGPDR